MQEFPIDEPQMKMDLTKPETEWASEGYKIATDFVYKNIEQNSTPSDQYVKEGQHICHR